MKESQSEKKSRALKVSKEFQWEPEMARVASVFLHGFVWIPNVYIYTHTC